MQTKLGKGEKGAPEQPSIERLMEFARRGAAASADVDSFIGTRRIKTSVRDDSAKIKAILDKLVRVEADLRNQKALLVVASDKLREMPDSFMAKVVESLAVEIKEAKADMEAASKAKDTLSAVRLAGFIEGLTLASGRTCKIANEMVETEKEGGAATIDAIDWKVEQPSVTSMMPTPFTMSGDTI